MRGAPVEVPLPKRARDAEIGRALWLASERLTGVEYDLDASRAARAKR
jgi:hypothetical protein